MALPRYTVPRHLDRPGQFLPGLTLVQCAWFAASLALASIAWHSRLPLEVKKWVVIYAPLLGFFIKRHIKGWDALQWATAYTHRLTRPRRTVYQPRED